jgi:charged multivesicular body protein 3
VCVNNLQAGLIEEMMDDAFEALDNDEEMEEEVQNEVDKVLFELTAGKLKAACDNSEVMMTVHKT